jgi:poly-gamma-glutamate synthesis protein (capsule biosynthesis protein)
MALSKNIFRLLFTGDLSLTGVFHQEILNGNDIFSDELSQTIKQADYCICNFEGPATQIDTPVDKTTRLRSPQNSIQFLTSKNIRVFNLANNHIFDCGVKGYFDTVNEIKTKNAYFFGAGKDKFEAGNPLYLNSGGLVIALIGISQHEGMVASKNNPGVFSEKEFCLLKIKVKEARKQARWIILNFHGGEEYTTIPSPAKRRVVRKLASIPDVDIVICHHSHTFQGIEKFKNKTIFYSLGNFVFDIKSHHLYPLTHESTLISFAFSDEGFNYELIPVIINYKERKIELGSGEFIEHVKSISEFTNYRKKWMSEAVRVLFIKNPDMSEDIDRLQSQSPVKWFLQRKFYKKALLILSDRYSRNLYFYAVFKRLFK